MATKKPEAGAKPKKSKPRDAAASERKIGSRVETMKVRLTPMQIDDVRSGIVDKLAQLDKLEEEKKSATSTVSAKIKELKSQIRIETTVVQRGAREEEVTIEEWLDERTNEVKRRRADTGEQVGDARTARGDELQSKLFDDEDDSDVDDFGGDPPAGEPVQ